MTNAAHVLISNVLGNTITPSNNDSKKFADGLEQGCEEPCFSGKPCPIKGDVSVAGYIPRISSVQSVMTAETEEGTFNTGSCHPFQDGDFSDGDDSSVQFLFVDDETERSSPTSVRYLTGSTALSWEISPEVCMNTRSARGDEECKEIEDDEQAIGCETYTRIVVKHGRLPPHRRGCSILKRSFKIQEIPLKNQGWKTLPKVDVDMLLKLHNGCRSPKVPLAPAVSAPEKNSACSTKADIVSKRSVSFSYIQVRNYQQTIGDNPSVSYGTPISLDWQYEESGCGAISVDDYEVARGTRRSPRQMMLNYYHRRNILMYTYGFSEKQVDAAEKDANRWKSQRSFTKMLLPCLPLEDLLTSAVRKTKRRFVRKDSQNSTCGLTSYDDSASCSARSASSNVVSDNHDGSPKTTTTKAAIAVVEETSTTLSVEGAGTYDVDLAVAATESLNEEGVCRVEL